MPTNEYNELPLPMLAFKLEGMDDSIELTIDEVWGYPNETSYGGGYGAKGNLSIRAGEYMVVNATHYFTKGELYSFLQQMKYCYEVLDGFATLDNTDRELDLKCTFNKKGHVLIEGHFQKDPSINNKLTFELRSDQTQAAATISSLKAVAEIFSDNKGVKKGK